MEAEGVEPDNPALRLVFAIVSGVVPLRIDWLLSLDNLGRVGAGSAGDRRQSAGDELLLESLVCALVVPQDGGRRQRNEKIGSARRHWPSALICHVVNDYLVVFYQNTACQRFHDYPEPPLPIGTNERHS